jgi:transposase-like protein
MNDQPFDSTRFFDHFSRFVETDELGSVVDRLNARYLALIHENRQLIEGATVLDLASHDGRFSFAALKNGAAHVVGIDFSKDLVEKSLANMEYYNVPADKYEFLSGDIFELIGRVQPCDVVLCFGIFYHINSHFLLLTKIAELDPRTLIIDSNISQLESAVIELRGPEDPRSLRKGWMEGYPSRAALDAMLSNFGWKFDYVDWQHSGLIERPQMRDYEAGKRVSVVVDCDRQDFSTEERERAVQLVLETQRDRGSQWRTIMQVASRLGITQQALHSWVRKAEREDAGQTDFPQSVPPENTPT